MKQLTGIMRGADTFRPDLTPQSSGLPAFSLGLSQVFQNDLEMLFDVESRSSGQQSVPGPAPLTLPSQNISISMLAAKPSWVQ
ncbi:hypothetical protein [Methylomonas rapida]|uniref:Uncharacterized protein n=1 Tax=Methylomonas rapida TaxID=2963939 RepID=A0ABY7GQC2_9GAMM|nr:hypothetical protein [Methylomonas rapida]WAR46709.1 hypothetical protein NM686_009400 [Methylomonas rapida]